MKMKILEINGCQVEIYKDEARAARAAAEETIKTGEESIEKFGAFYLNLSGGETILKVLRILAEEYAKDKVWTNTWIVWGDEHITPPESEENNYFLASSYIESLLKGGMLSPRHVHRILTSTATGKVFNLKEAEKEARRYDRLLRKFPRLDLSFLGMGSDLHTAGILPEKASKIISSDNLVEAIEYPPGCPGSRIRITMTPKAYKSSLKTILLVMGQGKREALKKVLTEPVDLIKMPGTLIRVLTNSKVITDEVTAELLLKALKA